MRGGQRFLSEYMSLDNRNLTNCRVLEGVRGFIGMNQRVIGKESEYKLYLYLRSSEINLLM
jgi:hypothetical protein